MWRDVIDSPKSGRGRIIPMTLALAEALGKILLVRGAPVLRRDDRKSLRHRDLKRWLGAAQRQASVRVTEGPHILRHTFCSHLAMRGAAAKAIQELAGHTNLGTCTSRPRRAKERSGCSIVARTTPFLEKSWRRPPTVRKHRGVSLTFFERERDLNPQEQTHPNTARSLIFSSKGSNPVPFSPVGAIATSHPD